VSSWRMSISSSVRSRHCWTMCSMSLVSRGALRGASDGMELMSSHVDIARLDSGSHRGSSRRQWSSSMSALQATTSKPLEPRHADDLHELQSSLVLQLRPTDHRSKPARNQVSTERPRASSVQVGECARVVGASPSISCASSAARSSSSHRAALAWSIRRGTRSLLSDKAHRRV